MKVIRLVIKCVVYILYLEELKYLIYYKENFVINGFFDVGDVILIIENLIFYMV